MTIEEAVQKDPNGFQEILETRSPDIRDALQELSLKLDGIIGGAIREYAGNNGVEADVSQIPSYKTLNWIITGKLDALISEHIREKRKDL